MSKLIDPALNTPILVAFNNFTFSCLPSSPHPSKTTTAYGPSTSSWTRRGYQDASAHESVERAYIQVRPLLLFLLILYTDYTHQNHDATLTQRGGHTPLPIGCSSFDPVKRRHALLAMSFNTGVEGVVRPLILFYLKLLYYYNHMFRGYYG